MDKALNRSGQCLHGNINHAERMNKDNNSEKKLLFAALGVFEGVSPYARRGI